MATEPNVNKAAVRRAYDFMLKSGNVLPHYPEAQNALVITAAILHLADQVARIAATLEEMHS